MFFDSWVQFQSVDPVASCRQRATNRSECEQLSRAQSIVWIDREIVKAKVSWMSPIAWIQPVLPCWLVMMNRIGHETGRPWWLDARHWRASKRTILASNGIQRHWQLCPIVSRVRGWMTLARRQCTVRHVVPNLWDHAIEQCRDYAFHQSKVQCTLISIPFYQWDCRQNGALWASTRVINGFMSSRHCWLHSSRFELMIIYL